MIVRLPNLDTILTRLEIPSKFWPEFRAFVEEGKCPSDELMRRMRYVANYTAALNEAVWELSKGLEHEFPPDDYQTPADYALALNANLLKQLSGQREAWFLDPDQVTDDFAAWLKGCGWDGQTGLTPAGKNFASFDRQFLKRLPRFEQVVRLSHRTLDPAVLFWHSEDEKLPDSKTCYERAGLNSKVAHTAVEDALAVVRLVRMGIKRLRGTP